MNKQITYANDFLFDNYSKLKSYTNKKDVDLEINPDGHIHILNSDGIWRDCGIIEDPNIIESIGLVLASENKMMLNEKNPILDVQIPYDNARCHVKIPPACEQPTISLRFHNENFRDLSSLKANGMFTDEQHAFLLDAVKKQKNIIISGETGSGKTTLLSALLNEIDANERLIIIEDTPEITVKNVNGQVRNVSFIPTGQYVTGQMAVKAALRETPTRIIYGEVRDQVALDLVTSWNTGHRGGFGTIHAKSATHVREQLIKYCGNNTEFNASYIDEALEVVIQLQQVKNGNTMQRRITEIIDHTETK